MIKINLLPLRAAKKKENAKQQIAIAILAVAAILIIAIVVYTVTLAKISATKGEIARAEQEITNLKAKIGEIDNLKKLQAEVRKKLEVLSQLRKDKAGPSKRLAKLSDATPDKVWITKYMESSTNVSIAGVAQNEDMIAEFMRKLVETKEFFNVELMLSEQAEMSGVKVKKFELSCSLIEKKDDASKPAQKK